MRLDEIKARVADTGAKLNEYEPSPFTIDTARDLLMLDIPALVSAVEAVLELHHAQCDHAICIECHFTTPCPTVAVIRDALGEDE